MARNQTPHPKPGMTCVGQISQEGLEVLARLLVDLDEEEHRAKNREINKQESSTIDGHTST